MQIRHLVKSNGTRSEILVDACFNLRQAPSSLLSCGGVCK